MRSRAKKLGQMYKYKMETFKKKTAEVRASN